VRIKSAIRQLHPWTPNDDRFPAPQEEAPYCRRPSNPRALQIASVNAQAFTNDNHIYFGRGQLQPESAGGRELIAHALTFLVESIWRNLG
jgi:hypothetical protein